MHWRKRSARELYAMREQDGDADDRRMRASTGAAHSARKPGKPAVIADIWDNPGGGIAGDGTLILRGCWLAA